jgi:hypothetical protein
MKLNNSQKTYSLHPGTLDIFSKLVQSKPDFAFTYPAPSSSLKKQLQTTESVLRAGKWARISQKINASAFIYAAHLLDKEDFLFNPIMFLCGQMHF